MLGPVVSAEKSSRRVRRSSVFSRCRFGVVIPLLSSV